MNRIQRHILSLTVLLVLVAIPTFVVFAKELGRLDVSGPGIDGQLTLTDHDQMMSLEGSGFFELPTMVKPPENLGAGYDVTAHLNLDGKLVPFVQMVYYPAEEGEPGYWHITGRLNGESMQAVDQWGRLSPRAENAFRDVMAANKITLQPAILAAVPKTVPESAPAAVAPAAEPAGAAVSSAAAPEPIQTPYMVLASVALALVLLGAGLALRRRTVNQRSA